MNDTTPEIQRLFREKIMARSGEERIIMGAEMFDAAAEMVKASLSANLSRMEWRHQYFKRIYGENLPTEDAS